MKVFTLVATKLDEVRVGVYSPSGLNQCWLDADEYLKKGWKIGVNWQDIIEEGDIAE